MRRCYSTQKESQESLDISDYLAYWTDKDNKLIDLVSGMQHPNVSLGRYSDGYWGRINNGSGKMCFWAPISSTTVQYFCRTNLRQWNNTTPNPPTNGLCPEYYGDSIRCEMEFYILESSMATSNACQLMGEPKSNNVNMRGFGFVRAGNPTSLYASSPAQSSKYYFIECSTSHNNTSWYKEVDGYTLPTSDANSQRCQLDIGDSGSYRLKFFDARTNELIADSGLRGLNVTNGSLYPIGTSDDGSYKCHARCKYIRISRGEKHTDMFQ